MHPSAGVKRARSQDDHTSSDTSMSPDASLSIGARVTQRPRREDPSDRGAQSQTQDHSNPPPAAAVASALQAATRIPQTDQGATPAERSRGVVGASATAAVHQPAAQQLSLIQPPGAAAPLTQAAAAVRRRQLSPAQRCDPDSLSLVFAHLGTADFLAAIRVCKGWHAARTKPAAWPKLHLPSIIRSLQDSNHNGPECRRLNISVGSVYDAWLAALSGPTAAASTNAAAHSAAVAVGSMWCHATDAKLRVPNSARGNMWLTKAAWESSLKRLAQLPHLCTLHLHECIADGEAAAAFYRAVASRLQVLILSGHSNAMLLHLPLLSNLRVLVLDAAPAAGQLHPLHRLEYLRFRSAWPPLGVVATLRWLSSEHSLRSLSVGAEHCHSDYWEPLFQPARTADEAAEFAEFDAAQAPTAHSPVVVDWTKPCGLTDVSMMGELPATLVSSICALPQLTRLQCPSRHLWQGDPPPVSTLAILQRLSLFWRAPEGVRSATQLHSFPDWQQLSRLRVLELTSASAHVSGRVAMSAADLQRLLATCTTTLEELRLDPSIRINHGEAGASAASTGSIASPSFTAAAAQQIEVLNGWSVLARCTQLRVLKIALQSATASSGMLVALALLPNFQSLELDMAGGVYLGDGFSLPADLLSCFCHSSSWCSLHIHWPSNYVYGDLLLGDGGLPQQLPPDSASAAVSTRLRVYDHIPQSAMVRSYAIRADLNGVKRWQSV